MKQVKFKCSKCGYAQVIPDKTESVLCGNCGTWNRPRSLFAGLEQAAPEEKSEGSILQKFRDLFIARFPMHFQAMKKTICLNLKSRRGQNPACFH